MLFVCLFIECEDFVQVTHLSIRKHQLSVRMIRRSDSERLHPLETFLRFLRLVLPRTCLKIVAKVALCVLPAEEKRLKACVDLL